MWAKADDLHTVFLSGKSGRYWWPGTNSHMTSKGRLLIIMSDHPYISQAASFILSSAMVGQGLLRNRLTELQYQSCQLARCPHFMIVRSNCVPLQRHSADICTAWAKH